MDELTQRLLDVGFEVTVVEGDDGPIVILRDPELEELEEPSDYESWAVLHNVD